MKDRDVIDAQFDVVKPAPKPIRRKWRLVFDWRNFLIVGGLSALVAARELLK